MSKKAKKTDYTDWPQAIRGFLELMDAYAHLGAKQYLLFVEGKTDYEKYSSIFQSTIIYNGARYNINVPRENYCYNFEHSTSIQDFGQPIDSKFIDWKKNNQWKQAQKRSYDFVIDSIDYYELNANRLTGIDCYGVIDRDFGHNIKDVNQISMTETHDHETMLLFDYFPAWIKTFNTPKQQDIITQMSTILDFTFRQGLLGRYFSQYCTKYDESVRGSLNSLFIGNFDNEISFDSSIRLFDFKVYFQRYQKLSNQIKTIHPEFNAEDILKKQCDGYFKVKKKVLVISDLITKWIKDEDLSSQENRRLHEIFKYSNGHFIFQQMLSNSILQNSLMKGLNDETDISNKLLAIAKKEQYKQLSCHNPIYDYVKYRLLKNEPNIIEK